MLGHARSSLTSRYALIEWAEAYAEDLRRASSAAAIDEEQADSELW
jgi:hypothetical protein